jgi:lipoprotein-anchoring transpeptidase ErfK/SrfK
MCARIIRDVVCLAAIVALNESLATAQTEHTRRALARTARLQRQPAPPLPCGDLVSFQVLLDRQGLSPGEIDGRTGDNFTHALIALQSARHVPTTGQPDCATWHALGGDTAGPMLATYTVTTADVKGPFEKRILSEINEQAKLSSLGYRSTIEMLGERFHASPALIQQLNRDVPIVAGRQIRVPAVPPFDPNAKPSFDPTAEDVTIQVAREESALRATHGDGTLVFFAPVTTGSVHDPLPPGEWTVAGVSWHPVFHYNPDLFWDAHPKDSKATIRAGPNNPVGVVWIGLNLGHYGLHGTPEPGRIGHTESHGCVRLTNWDAARVAALVKRGTHVVFIADPPPQPPKQLRMPLDGVGVDAMKGGFAERRDGRPHEAADLLAPRNAPVRAVEDGAIAKLFYSKGGGGNTIYQFDPTGHLCYYYAHLDRYAEGLRDGQRVSQGQVIGYVGTSGNAPPNRPHLHFAVFELNADQHWWQGRAIDPYLVFTGKIR